jgi:hypothetical protein
MGARNYVNGPQNCRCQAVLNVHFRDRLMDLTMAALGRERTGGFCVAEGRFRHRDTVNCKRLHGQEESPFPARCG